MQEVKKISKTTIQQKAKVERKGKTLSPLRVPSSPPPQTIQPNQDETGGGGMKRSLPSHFDAANVNKRAHTETFRAPKFVPGATSSAQFAQHPHTRIHLAQAIYEDPDKAAIQIYSECHRTLLGRSKFHRFLGNLLHLQSASFMYASSNEKDVIRHRQEAQYQAHARRHSPSTLPYTPTIYDPKRTSQVMERAAVVPPSYPRTFASGKNVLIQFQERQPHFVIKQVPFSGDSVTGGVVAWMRRLHSVGCSKTSNPALPNERGAGPLMEISRSSNSKGSPADAADEKITSSCTRSNPTFDENGNQTNWYMFDFKNLRVFPTHYSITHGWKQGKFCLQSWKLEGSINGHTWITLCNHVNDQSLNQSPTNSNAWVLANQDSSRRQLWLRFFRVSMTSPNSNGSYTMCLARFEVFGAVIDLSKPIRAVAM